MSDSVETFGAPTLTDVQFNDDGSLKQSGKQNVKFYHAKRLSFRGKIKVDESGEPIIGDNGKVIPIMDPKTGLPFKEAFEEVVEKVRIETRGDTNIVDDIASDFHKRQFYRQYKFFREGKIPDGNPIEDFDFFQSPSVIMELHMLGIHVLQQVAIMSDLECQQLKDQSGYELRDIAAQWLKINSPDSQSTKATQQDLEIARLKQRLAEMEKGTRRGNFAAASAEKAVVPEASIRTMEVDIKDKPRRV